MLFILCMYSITNNFIISWYLYTIYTCQQWDLSLGWNEICSIYCISWIIFTKRLLILSSCDPWLFLWTILDLPLMHYIFLGSNRRVVLYSSRWFKFLSCLLSTFFLCSSLLWCSLSFSWINSLPHSWHFTIGWWWICLAWLIRSSYFANFWPHWSQTFFSLWWRIPKQFLYNWKSMAIKRLYLLPIENKPLQTLQPLKNQR